MDQDIVEMPQIDIPDEIRQADVPEIEETTPHPKPESPLATYSSYGKTETDDRGEGERIGFFS